VHQVGHLPELYEDAWLEKYKIYCRVNTKCAFSKPCVVIYVRDQDHQQDARSLVADTIRLIQSYRVSHQTPHTHVWYNTVCCLYRPPDDEQLFVRNMSRII